MNSYHDNRITILEVLRKVIEAGRTSGYWLRCDAGNNISFPESEKIISAHFRGKQ